tara:strand:+ start:639 stop:2003 length:1365 start_codon:yes stop_codon:yes gene_type:complete
MKFTISEGEKDLIRRMHNNQKSYDTLIKESIGLVSTVSESVVITDWVSPDDRYLILFDNMYDLQTRTSLGDIWENFDNFKLFISHSFEVATNVPQQIKEEVLNTINSLVLTESISDMSKIKPILRQLIREEGFVDWIGSGIKKTGEWAADEVKRFGGDVADIAKTGLEGIKKAGIAISTGDWKSILDLLGKGMLFFARKLRSLLYNPVGMVLDSILIATGIGKAAQWIPWAIVVALDIYEISTGNFEEKDMPTWMRFLMVGVDVLGLVFAGGLAGSAKAALSVFRGARTAEEFAAIAVKNPKAVSWIQKIIGAFSKVPQLLGKAATYLKSTKLAKGSTFIQGVLGKAEGVLAKGTESLTKITNTAKNAGVAGKQLKSTTNVVKKTAAQTLKAGGKEGVKTAATVTAIDRGFKKGAQLYKGISDAEMEAIEMTSKSISDYEMATGKTLGAVWDAS